MAARTGIEWTDATWNPITGCSAVSEGCARCYAARLAATRLKHHPSRAGLVDGAGNFNGALRFNAQWLDEPLRYRKPRRIFCCAHADLFHARAPDAWIDAIMDVIERAPRHRFQLLTKRPRRMQAYFLARGGAPANAWLGVSVEHQAAADERVPVLLATPCRTRWACAEPLLGDVSLALLRVRSSVLDPAAPRLTRPGSGLRWDIETWLDALLGVEHRVRHAESTDGPFRSWVDRGSIRVPRLDWVVAGGESGPGARPLQADWALRLQRSCEAAGVSFFFKQFGGATSKSGGCRLGGREFKQFPKESPDDA